MESNETVENKPTATDDQNLMSTVSGDKIKQGQIIFATIKLEDSKELVKRFLYVNSVNDTSLQCFNMTSKPKEFISIPIKKTDENKLKFDSYIKTDVCYSIDKSSFILKSDFNITEKDQRKISKFFDTYKDKNPVIYSDTFKAPLNTSEKLYAQALHMAENFKKNPEDVLEFINFKAKFYGHSNRNNLILFSQNRDAIFVKTAKQWKNDFSYLIKKGEKASYMLRPVTMETFKRNNKDIFVTKATRDEKIKLANGTIPIKKSISFRPYPVFDIAQTNCPAKDYPKVLDYGHDSLEHKQIYDEFKTYIQSQKIDIIEKDIKSVALKGFYDPAQNSITINSELLDTSKLSTLTHEFAHALLHNTTSLGNASVMEFEAECLSIMTHLKLGLEVDNESQGYISTHYNTIVPLTNTKDMFDRLSNQIQHINKTFIEPKLLPLAEAQKQKQQEVDKHQSNELKNNEINKNFLRNL